jgi:type IV pilus assembly protein PilB
MMAVSDDIEGLIVSGASTLDLRRAAESEGMRSLRDDGFVKARDGVTTALEVLRVAR